MTRQKTISILLALTLLINPFTNFISARAADPDDPTSHSIEDIATAGTTETDGELQEIAPPMATAGIPEQPQMPQPLQPRYMTRAAATPFTYTGSYDITEYATGKFYARLLTNGTFTPTMANMSVDVFLVGGGGNGANGVKYGGGGGGGGYTTTANTQILPKSTAVSVIIGQEGGATSFKNLSAAGGSHATNNFGAKGGSGGGRGHGTYRYDGEAGASNGGGVYGTTGLQGDGQGTNTYAFGGDISPFNTPSMLFAGGGGGGGNDEDLEGVGVGYGGAGGAGGGGKGGPLYIYGKPENGFPNTGGGGGGSFNRNNNAGKGGSGIVIIRWENQAPTLNGAVTVPTSINRWQTATYNVSFPDASDPEGGTMTYVIDYAVDGSGAFSSYTTTTATSFTYTIPATNPANICFRVKAVDPLGAESVYIYSGWTSVIYNSPPSTPTGMTAPSAVNSWQATSVTFGCNASTDVNGDTIYYVWEIAVNGGGWTNVQSSTSRSLIRNIVKPTDGYYQARVRAYDGVEYSGYLTSGIVTITHDTAAPIIQINCNPDATTSWAKDFVTITVIVSDGLSGLKTLTVPEGVTPAGNIALSGTSATKTFTAAANGTYAFTVTDNANISASSSVSPSKIDTDFPTLTYTTIPPAGQFTNGNVTVNLTLADSSSGLATFLSLAGSENISGKTGAKSFVAIANGVYPFSTTDGVMHNTAINVNINMIDRIKSVTTIIPRVKRWTNAASVILDVAGTDDYSGVQSLTLPNGSSFAGTATTYSISKNGEYTASSKDRATNISDIAKLNYTWFDRTKPTIKFVQFEATENAVQKFFENIFKIVSDKHLRIVVEADDTPAAGEGESGVTQLFYRVFKADGTLVQDWTNSPISTAPVINYEVNGYVELYVKDAAGTSSDIQPQDILIDTTAPTYKKTYSTTETTSQPVIVTLKLSDEADGSGVKGWVLPDGGVFVNQSEITYTFTENGTKIFVGYDNAGNLVEAVVSVDNIHSPKVPVSAWENNKVVMDAVLHAVGKTVIEDVSEADLLKPTYIDLSSNGMTSVPAVFGRIKNLEHLDLRGNELETVPACIEGLTKLKYLDLSNNNLSDISIDMSKLALLEFFDVSLNYLVDYELPIIIANFRNVGNFTNNDQPDQYTFELIEPVATKEYIGNSTQFAVKWTYNSLKVSSSLETHRAALFAQLYPAYHTYRPMLYKYTVQNGEIKKATADYVQVYLPQIGVVLINIEIGKV